MKVLLTGGAGYIGSHVLLELLTCTDATVIIIDNFSNSCPISLERVYTIAGGASAAARVTLVQMDLCEATKLTEVFAAHAITHVMHFAGLKAVGESLVMPLSYYHNNVTGTLVLLEAMTVAQVPNLLFSSSATVYGSAPIPCDEATSTTGIGITNPYGKSKYMIEEILKDVVASQSLPWHVLSLRYFNPIGAHASGMIGEDPRGVPNNLMPFVAQVAVGQRPEVMIFGDDYNTPDGTGIRDYIHVVDLAKGHVAALLCQKESVKTAIFNVYNLGSGIGSSVRQVIAGMEKACGHAISTRVGPRRAGDFPINYASADKAERDLHWKTTLTMDDMCRDHWRWQSANPFGYSSTARTSPVTHSMIYPAEPTVSSIQSLKCMSKDSKESAVKISQLELPNSPAPVGSATHAIGQTHDGSS